jgi:hypothetical protein
MKSSKPTLEIACLAVLGQALACQSVSREPDHSIYGERGSTVAPQTTPVPDKDRAQDTPFGELVRVAGEHEGAMERDFALRDALPKLSVRITSPKAGDLIQANTLPIDVETAGLPGGHVEVRIDDQPALSGELQGGRLTVDLTKAELDPGVHIIRAFAVRPWNESIKVPGAMASTYFFYGDRKGPVPELMRPAIVYNEPRGDFHVDESTNRVLADFVVTGVTMGDKAYKVRYYLDDREPVVLTSWTPLWFEALPAGAHRLRFELVSADDSVVPAPFGRVEGTFSVIEDAKPRTARGVL